jgi:hypothetical protein
MVKLVIPVETFIVNHLFEDAEFFLEQAKELREKDAYAARRYIRASIITGFAALEAFLNMMLYGYLIDEEHELELVERALVEEKKVELNKDGYFAMTGSKFHSMDDKLAFLHWKRERSRIPRGNAAWESYVTAKTFRDELVHPKPGKPTYSRLTVSAAETCLNACLHMAKVVGWRPHAKAPDRS